VKKNLFIFTLFISQFVGAICYAVEYDVDSLKTFFYETKEVNLDKGLTAIRIADKFRKVDVDSANVYLSKGQTIANSLKSDKLKGEALLISGLLKMYEGKYEEVVNLSKQARSHFTTIKDSLGIAKSISNTGLAYDYWGKYDLATKNYFESLRLHSRLKEWEGVVSGNINVGVVYYIQEQYEKSLEFYLIAKEESEKHDITDFNSMIYNNIALCGGQLKDYKLVVEYYNKAIEESMRIDDLASAATILANLSLSHERLGNLDSAMFVLDKAELLALKLKDKQSLSFIYTRKGTIERGRKNLKKSLEYLIKAKEMAESIHALVQIEKAYEQLTDTYFEMGEYKKALENVLMVKAFSDSVLNEKNQIQLAELDIQYNTEKKEAEILRLKHESELQSVELEKKKFILWGASVGILLMLVVIAIVYNSYKLKSKANREITNQKEIIEEAHREITDSIAYAKRIQSAILPPDKIVKEYLKQSFILYKPKDIVAGDFYWMEHKEEKILFAAADCTGHGVPGAMVSVVCNNALNRSVREHGLTDPAEILNKTRDIVVEEFEKSDEDVKDGMDIALCSLEGNILKYAGAHNPLLIIRKGELIETKADKQPIGKSDNPKPYTTHEFEVVKGDSIYIFSDGYVDQFGGQKGKKFKVRAFRDLLLSIQEKSMEEQKMIIDDTFETWRGNLEQIDDVCVIGVRV